MQVLSVTPLTTNQIDELCRHMTVADFKAAVERYGYSQIFQVHSALVSRIGEIRLHLENGGDRETEWRGRARGAMAFLEKKRRLAAAKMAVLRSCSINSLGGDVSPASGRIRMIRAMIGMLDRHADPSRFSEEERAAYDACRDVVGVATDPIVFGRYTYDPAARTITDGNRYEIAYISHDSYDSDEIGCRMAAAVDLMELADRAVVLARDVADRSGCPGSPGHPGCPHCSAVAFLESAESILGQLR